VQRPEVEAPADPAPDARRAGARSRPLEVPRPRADRPAVAPAEPRLDLAARLLKLAAQVAADRVTSQPPTPMRTADPPVPPTPVSTTDGPRSRDMHPIVAPAPSPAPAVLTKPASVMPEQVAAAPAVPQTLVHVAIGRVEVRAAPEPAPPRRPRREAAGQTSLETYLARRNGTER
jgi:hypothetical protein